MWYVNAWGVGRYFSKLSKAQGLDI